LSNIVGRILPYFSGVQPSGSVARGSENMNLLSPLKELMWRSASNLFRFLSERCLPNWASVCCMCLYVRVCFLVSVYVTGVAKLKLFVQWSEVHVQQNLQFRIIIKCSLNMFIPTPWSSPSWEANSHLANQERYRLLWNPEVHYHVHKSPPVVPILNQMHPVHNFPPNFLRIHSVVIFACMPRSSEWSFPLMFPDQKFAQISHAPMHSSCPAHLILLDLTVLIIFGEVYKVWSSTFAVFSILTPVPHS